MMRDIDDGDLQPSFSDAGGLPISQPSVEVAESTAFLFNNLSASTVRANATQFVAYFGIYGDSYRHWLAEYFIDRVKKESNFHSLYYKSVLATEDKRFIETVKQETYRAIKRLLESAKRTANSSDNRTERDALKSLGTWLGLMTIARNQPILAEELDLKALILNSCQQSEQDLVYVLPFVTKVLAAVNKSEVFNVKCAWIMSLLKVLASLHQQENVKLSLQFDVEGLFRELRIDLVVFQESGEIVEPETEAMLSDTESDHTCSGWTYGRMEPLSISQEVNIMPARLSASEFTVRIVETLLKQVSIPVEQLRPLRIEPHLFHSLCQEVVAAATNIIHEIIERSVLVAVATTEVVCRKDFALDASDRHLRDASQQMARAMTASLAAVSCRSPLEAKIPKVMQERVHNMLRMRNVAMNPCLPLLAEKVVSDVSESIMKVTCEFILSSASDRAALEVERRLKNELATRRNCKLQNISFETDNNIATEQQHLPEPLRLSTSTTGHRLEIYEKFGKYISLSTATESSENVTTRQYSDISLPTQSSLSRETTSSQSSGLTALCEKFAIVLRDVHRLLEESESCSPMTAYCKPYHAICLIKDRLQYVIASPSHALIDHLVQDMTGTFLHAYEQPSASTSQASDPMASIVATLSKRLRELYVGVLRLLTDPNSVGIDMGHLRQVITKKLIMSADEHRFKLSAVDTLIRYELLSFRDYDVWLAAQIQHGNVRAAEFLQKFTTMYLRHSSEPLPATMLPISTSLLGTRLIQQLSPRPSLPQHPVVQGRLADAMDDQFPTIAPSDPRNVAQQFLKQWIGLCHDPREESFRRQTQLRIYAEVRKAAAITTEEGLCNFLKFCVDVCTKGVLPLLQDSSHDQHALKNRLKCFNMLDATVKLMRLVVSKNVYDDKRATVNLAMLEKVLAVVTDLLLCEHEAQKRNFNPLPYHRILLMFFKELAIDDEAMPPEDRCTILHHFGQALYAVQPRRAPVFAFHWLDIVGHRDFIAKHLSTADGCPNPTKAPAVYAQLIFCNLRFLAPFLQSPPTPSVIAKLYKGTLRVLLVVLHDFPEFFCRYHYVLCDCIPPNCIQLRNIVLSASPTHQRLPDPFTMSFQEIEECVAELLVDPENHVKVSSVFPAGELKTNLDHYLSTRLSTQFLTYLPHYLVAKTPRSTALPPTIAYNMTAINAVTLYIGARSIDSMKASGQRISLTTVESFPAMDVFQSLLDNVTSEGRYILLNALANQLRYPNTHTYFFACVTLLLFRKAESDTIREQIARVLFERVVALRPHPWGVLWVFIELLRNPVYKFWSYEFAHCAPEIEQLLTSVEKTARTKHQQQEIPAC